METCRHQGCRCEGTPGYDGFCGTYCAEAQRRPGSESQSGSGGCACGHPPCGEARP